MTVSYTAEVANCNKFGCFLKLLLRWKGSVYKLVWLDLLTFLLFYYFLNLVYRFVLGADGKRNFESIVHYCSQYGSLIPLSFVLGFYVSLVMKRWWDQYMCIPWPDSIAVFVSAHFHGQDERGRVMRRTVMRYVCVCLTIVFTWVAPRVKRRFPTLASFVDAGLLLENEKLVIEHMDQIFPQYPKHWMPIVWAASIITRARKEGRIRDDFAVKTIIDELNRFRANCGGILYYDWITVPLVYTQVVTLAVYTYFLCSLMAQQWVEPRPSARYINYVDLYFPIFTTLQFFFYMGWLKVAETLINPFGEDDDDFEVNWVIDRNLQMSYLIVDEMHHEHPELVRDQYWDEVFPNELPYDGDVKREEPPEPSTAKIDVAADLLNVKVEEISAATQSSMLMNNKSKRESTATIDETVARHTINTILNRLLSRDNLPRRKSPRSSSQLKLVKHDSNSSASLHTPPLLIPTPSQLATNDDQEEIEEEIKTITIEAPTATSKSEIHELFKLETGLNESSSAQVSFSFFDSDTPDKDEVKDDFQRLKEQRARERAERQRVKFLFNVELSTHVQIPMPRRRDPARDDELSDAENALLAASSTVVKYDTYTSLPDADRVHSREEQQRQQLVDSFTRAQQQVDDEARRKRHKKRNLDDSDAEDDNKDNDKKHQ